MHIIYGLLGILLSFAIIKYRKEFINIIGPIGWAQRYLGSGGTLTVVFFSAIALMIFSFLIMIGQQGVLLGGFAKYFAGS